MTLRAQAPYADRGAQTRCVSAAIPAGTSRSHENRRASKNRHSVSDSSCLRWQLMRSRGSSSGIGSRRWSRAGVPGAGVLRRNETGSTPGWLTDHRRALIGAKNFLSDTWTTYRDGRLRFCSRTPGATAAGRNLRLLAHVSHPRPRLARRVHAALETVRGGVSYNGRRHAYELPEAATSTVDRRCDVIRAGESWIPDINAARGERHKRQTGLRAARVRAASRRTANGVSARGERSAARRSERAFCHRRPRHAVLADCNAPAKVLGEDPGSSAGARSIWWPRAGSFDNGVALMGALDAPVGRRRDSARQGRRRTTGFRSAQTAFILRPWRRSPTTTSSHERIHGRPSLVAYYLC